MITLRTLKSLPPAALVTLLALAALPAAHAQSGAAADELLARLNAYRRQQGLPAVPKSPALTRVAEAHVQDLERHPPAGACNGHSWSPSRQWKACCYTDDHAKAQCMWDKPQEITAGAYPGRGFEIWAWRSGSMTLEFALEGWKGSEPHHAVIVNRGPWAALQWQAAGAAVSHHYAVVWFGAEPDTTASPPPDAQVTRAAPVSAAAILEGRP